MIHCYSYFFFFFFNDTATTEIYTLSLHDALPISGDIIWTIQKGPTCVFFLLSLERDVQALDRREPVHLSLKRSEEHTSELQSLAYLVCRLLLEKKKKKKSMFEFSTDLHGDILHID